MLKRPIKPGHLVAAGLGLAALAWVGIWLWMPQPLFDRPFSPLAEAQDGSLLSARVASDGQWRFPPVDSLPARYETALMHYEDRYFRWHPGVNPGSLVRALSHNLRNKGKRIGGSTLTMQVVRLMRQGKPRTAVEKCIEILWAMHLETRLSKPEIMQLYAAHAPFGGNVVGVNAASWRYFGRPPNDLTWAEAALLAVLPNNPAGMHPGRHAGALRRKRDRLLEKLHLAGHLDALQLRLSRAEPVPDAPAPLPDHARHLLESLTASASPDRALTTAVDARLQRVTHRILQHHHERLAQNRIYNAAAVIIRVRDGAVLAYAGNTGLPGNPGGGIDMAQVTRSTGSLLKPFLYATAMHHAQLLPEMLVADIPTRFQAFSPQNFDRTFHGAVPASRALARSLNVPAVRLLHSFGVPLFHRYLNDMGLNSLDKPPDYYGLSLILGGAEASLLDLTGLYADLARTVSITAVRHPGENRYEGIKPWLLVGGKPEVRPLQTLNPGAVYAVLTAMEQVERPEDLAQWRQFQTSRRIAWKTGTSFGHRDGWAIGVTPEFAIGVWTGNASAEGRPELTGIRTAAPVLFDLFAELPPTRWFEPPLYDMERVPVCRVSGYRSGPWCSSPDTTWVPQPGREAPVCPYHQPVLVHTVSKKRLMEGCPDFHKGEQTAAFVLPPVMAWYYAPSNPGYHGLPPLAAGCPSTEEPERPLTLIYPQENTRVRLTVELDGTSGAVVFEAAHRNPDEEIRWHLDNRYAGSTRGVHTMQFRPSEGPHLLTITDRAGNRMTRTFAVVTGPD